MPVAALIFTLYQAKGDGLARSICTVGQGTVLCPLVPTDEITVKKDLVANRRCPQIPFLLKVVSFILIFNHMGIMVSLSFFSDI